MRRPLLTPIHSTTSTSFSTPSSPESSSVRESDSAPTSPEHDSPPKLSITKLERASVAVEGIPCSPLPISELETAPDSVGGLADRLREATKEVHQAVMMPSIVHKLVSGSLPAPIYLSYLMGLLEIYIALEDALDEHTSHPHLASVYDSTLARANSLRSDIAYFIDEGVEPMQDFHQEDTAVDDYVRRLTQLGEEDGVEATLLLAHTYVRYLGDLSGGQSIQRSVRKAYALPPTGEGASFYEFIPINSNTVNTFANLDEAKQLKNWFRDGLDKAGELMSEGERKNVLEEAKAAFVFNMRLFESFETRVNCMDASLLGGGIREDQWKGVATKEQISSEKEESKFRSSSMLDRRTTSNLTIAGAGLAVVLSLYIASTAGFLSV